VNLYSLVDDILNNLNNVSFKVKAQVEDSIFSVSSNIAEGYCRRSLKENIHFINIALSSLGENYSHIFTLFNSKKIIEEKFAEYDTKHYSLENKLISFNKSMVKKLTKGDEWKSDYRVREIINQYNSLCE
jgi:four helix bundle protein